MNALLCDTVRTCAPVMWHTSKMQDRPVGHHHLPLYLRLVTEGAAGARPLGAALTAPALGGSAAADELFHCEFVQ